MWTQPECTCSTLVLLTRDNFFPRKTQAVPLLQAQQLFSYVTSATTASSQLIAEGTGTDQRQVLNPAYLRWFTQDQLVLSTLLSSMIEEILGQLTLCTTSHTAWDALHTIAVSAVQSQEEGHDCCCHFQKMKSLADTMAWIDNPLQDEEVLGYMLGGLGSVYKAIITTITARDEPMNLTVPSFALSATPHWRDPPVWQLGYSFE
uniref:Retrotransposon Copia-like N-terminal domain-containing protein n=1 Tax=Setaria viridis TaxID=4556 RepID=A0A4U6UNK6_SETVI|nr:hypothetical protein SEVIR_5G267500v2 [Setaria viridis]